MRSITGFLSLSLLAALTLGGCTPADIETDAVSGEAEQTAGYLVPDPAENSDHGYLLEDNRIPSIETCEEWVEFWVGAGPALSFAAAEVHGDPAIEVSTQIFMKNRSLDSDGDGVICYLEFEAQPIAEAQGPEWQTTLSLALTEEAALAPIEACKIEQAPPIWFTRAGFPQAEEYRVREGRVVVQLIYVDATDLPARGLPSEDADFWINGAGEFLEDMAEGKVDFEWRYENQYFRLPRPLADYKVTRNGGGNPRPFVQAAVSAGDPSIDFSDVDVVIAVLPPSVTPELADYSPALPLEPAFPFRTAEGLVYRGTMTGSDTRWEHGYLLIAHEMGHLLGLQDYYAYEANFAGDGSDQFRFMGEFDNMNHAAGRALEWTAWSRWLLGFLDDSQVRCARQDRATAHQVFTVSDLDGGPKMVVIPTGPFTAIAIESRRSLRHDAGLAADQQGALVYRVNTEIESGFGPLEIVQKPNLADPFLLDAPLRPGESVTVDGVTITGVEAGELWDAIEVKPAN